MSGNRVCWDVSAACFSCAASWLADSQRHSQPLTPELAAHIKLFSLALAGPVTCRQLLSVFSEEWTSGQELACMQWLIKPLLVYLGFIKVQEVLLTPGADYVMFVVLLGLSSSLSNPSIQASLTNSQLHSSHSNPSIHTSLRLSSLSNPPPTGMASSPRRRPAPISPLTLSPAGDQRRSLSKQLSPTMSPSLSPITQVRKCSLNLLIQHLTFSGGIFLIQNITSVLY